MRRLNLKETSEVSDWNQNLIEEFRANEGVVGGAMEGRPLLLLHHTGARSATERVNPLMYQVVNGGYAVFASKGGADTNPHWLYNLKAHPETKVEIGTETVAVTARVVEGEEYDRIWNQQTQDFSFFADYKEKTAREYIPIVVLART